MYRFVSNCEAEKASEIVFYILFILLLSLLLVLMPIIIIIIIIMLFCLTYMHGIDKYILGQTCFWSI